MMRHDDLWAIWLTAALRCCFIVGCLIALGTADIRAAEPWPTSGGDGGKVVEVTSLADQGPGTLRNALARGGARKIVFKVGGEIRISRPLQITKPFVTIAGETAPNPGITILGDKIRITTHDVVLRHIRVRVGEIGDSKPVNRDGISIEGEHSDKREVKRILIEHCSVAWAVDEGLSIWGKGVRDVAVRNTIVAETLRNSVHPKGDHSMGLMVGPGVENVVLQQNLIAHNVWRNPVIHGGASAVVVNNLIYNPRYAALHFYPHQGSGPTRVTAIGNVVIPGPDTIGALPALAKGINPDSKIFYDDNLPSSTGAFDREERVPADPAAEPFVDVPPIWFEDLRALSAIEVEQTILASVGARPTDRDVTDARIVAEVTDRGGRIRDHPDDPRLVAPPRIHELRQAANRSQSLE